MFVALKFLENLSNKNVYGNKFCTNITLNFGFKHFIVCLQSMPKNKVLSNAMEIMLKSI